MATVPGPARWSDAKGWEIDLWRVMLHMIKYWSVFLHLALLRFDGCGYLVRLKISVLVYVKGCSRLFERTWQCLMKSDLTVHDSKRLLGSQRKLKLFLTSRARGSFDDGFNFRGNMPTSDSSKLVSNLLWLSVQWCCVKLSRSQGFLNYFCTERHLGRVVLDAVHHSLM